MRPRAALDRLQGRSASRGSPSTPAAALIPNEAGPGHRPRDGEQVAGHYAVGWIKRGPIGVIGTNKKDAQETVDLLFEDLEAGHDARARGEPELSSRSRSCSTERGGDTSPSPAGRRSTRREGQRASRTDARG